MIFLQFFFYSSELISTHTNLSHLSALGFTIFLIFFLVGRFNQQHNTFLKHYRYIYIYIYKWKHSLSKKPCIPCFTHPNSIRILTIRKVKKMEPQYIYIYICNIYISIQNESNKNSFRKIPNIHTATHAYNSRKESIGKN